MNADYYRAALAAIAECRGPFSRDRLTHAQNVIEAMATTAREALAGTWEVPEGFAAPLTALSATAPAPLLPVTEEVELALERLIELTRNAHTGEILQCVHGYAATLRTALGAAQHEEGK